MDEDEFWDEIGLDHEVPEESRCLGSFENFDNVFADHGEAPYFDENLGQLEDVI